MKVDGLNAEYMNLYSSTEQPRQAVFRNSFPTGEPLTEIVVSSKGRANVDAFSVMLPA